MWGFSTNNKMLALMAIECRIMMRKIIKGRSALAVVGGFFLFKITF